MSDLIVRPRMLKSGKMVYEYAFEIARIDGKRKRKTKSGFRTKREAKEAGKIELSLYEKCGQTTKDTNISVADFFDLWMEKDCGLTCKESTLDGYHKKIRLYIKPSIGEYYLKNITKDILQDFIKDMYDKGFSKNTIYKTKEKLSMNPLRYPGAKSKLFKYIKTLIAKNELNGCTFYEPFAGSATLSWQLLDEGLISQAVINEKDPLLYHFWKSVFFHTDELVNLIKKTDINIDTWNECVRYKEDAYLSNKETYQIGFAGLFLNRTNFSGILKAGPIGGKAQTSKYKLDCRFNKERIIQSILDIAAYKNRVGVFNEDAIDFMEKEVKSGSHKPIFVYIDPPYYKAGPSLYRHFYTNEDHRQLAKYIKDKRFPWLLSYDDTQEIRDLYNKEHCVNLQLNYSVNSHRKEKELLIYNMGLLV